MILKNATYTFISLAVIILAIFLTVRYKFSEPYASNEVNNSGDPIFFLYDMEENLDLQNVHTISSAIAKSGNKSCMLNDSIEYSVTVNKKIQDIRDFKNVKYIQVSMELYSDNLIQDAALVLEITGENQKSIHWTAAELAFEDSSWTPYSNKFPLDGSQINNNSILKVYVWNKNYQKFYFDDFRVDFLF